MIRNPEITKNILTPKLPKFCRGKNISGALTVPATCPMQTRMIENARNPSSDGILLILINTQILSIMKERARKVPTLSY